MLRAVLFDMGGTLDGDGEHWLDRFARLYADAGLTFPREVIRRGFDHAELRASVDDAVTRAGLDPFVRQHLQWQSEIHGAGDIVALDAIADAFVRPIRDVARRNAQVLAELRQRGLALGVVSNACGNAQLLCDDLGYARFLDCVIDSRSVGVAKPDPRIFELAVQRLGMPAASTLMVGDSYERDIVPAHALGMRTAWLRPGQSPAVDRQRRPAAEVVIARLTDLLAVLAAPERTPA